MRYFYFILVLFFCACNSADKNSNEGTASNGSANTIVRNDTVYVIRNAEITPANSYSDLFMDSAAIEQFIQQKKYLQMMQKAFTASIITAIFSLHGLHL